MYPYKICLGIEQYYSPLNVLLNGNYDKYSVLGFHSIICTFREYNPNNGERGKAREKCGNYFPGECFAFAATAPLACSQYVQ